MKLEILVSAVNEDVDTLAERMNLQADAIIVNQCGENTYREYTYQEHRIRCYSFAERGVGLSRNNCLMHRGISACSRMRTSYTVPVRSGLSKRSLKKIRMRI